MAGSTDPHLALESVHVDVPGIDSLIADLSLTVEAGASLAIVGPSGSGKSTLLDCMTGWRVPTSGRVLVAGEDLSAMADGQRSRFRRDRIGVAFQDPYLLEELNVTDNIELVLRFRKRRVAAGRSDVGDLLEAFGLGDRAADRLVGLSGGERQRVSLARAILSATALLVADEPTASLDHANALQVIDALVEQATARGIPLVVATHDSDVAARMEKTVDLRNA